MMHSWHGGYDKECVPAWDYYPVLDAIADCQELVYPSASLDRLHSEKRYKSQLMPPTQFINLVRSASSPSGWEVESRGNKDVPKALTEAIQKLKSESAAVGLKLKDVMVKQGLSWGGEDVARVAPTVTGVQKHFRQKVFPKIPAR